MVDRLALDVDGISNLHIYLLDNMASLVLVLTLINLLFVPCHSLQMRMMSSAVVVVGCAGGAAESIACKLMSGGIPTTLVLDRKPASPVLMSLLEKHGGEVFYGELDRELRSVLPSTSPVSSIETLLSNKLLIAVGDDGDDVIKSAENRQRGKDSDSLASAKVLNLLTKKLTPSLKGIICTVDSASDASTGIGGTLFGRKCSDNLADFCTKASLPFSLLKVGQLTGGVPGKEPLPFIGLPALEPELHPSYTLLSVILTDIKSSSKSSSSSSAALEGNLCTRESLSEAVLRLLKEGSGSSSSSNELQIPSLQGQVISIAGNPPSDKEWKQLFARLRSADNVEILRVEFEEVLKPQALINWVADTWFPQALIDADAATILSGARPVRASKVGADTVRIVWEDLKPDLTIETMGGVDIKLVPSPTKKEGEEKEGNSKPALVAVRLSGGALPGEMQLMDRLIEGMNKNVYKKQFCVPLGSVKA